MVPLISTNGPVPNDENTPQYIIEPPPCFTVIFVHCLSNSSPNQRLMYVLPSEFIKLNLVSSENK